MAEPLVRPGIRPSIRSDIRPGIWPLARQALLGLCIATLIVLLLLFAGSEDRGFIYVDF